MADLHFLGGGGALCFAGWIGRGTRGVDGDPVTAMIWEPTIDLGIVASNVAAVVRQRCPLPPAEPITALVCGGRDLDVRDYVHVARVLDALHGAIAIGLVVHGGARGADRLAGRWAFARGIIARVFPADWSRHGKAAGMIRNRAMLEDGRPDVVVAFPGGRGTANMVALALKRSVPVLRVDNRGAPELRWS